MYVVVRQGDVLARGSGVSGDPLAAPVTPQGGQLVPGMDQTAIASAVAIGQEDHSGLEVFTWAQRIPVLKQGGWRPPTELDDGAPAGPPGDARQRGTPSPRPWLSGEPTGPAAAPGRSPTLTT